MQSLGRLCQGLIIYLYAKLKASRKSVKLFLTEPSIVKSLAPAPVGWTGCQISWSRPPRSRPPRSRPRRPGRAPCDDRSESGPAGPRPAPASIGPTSEEERRRGQEPAKGRRRERGDEKEEKTAGSWRHPRVLLAKPAQG